MFDQYKSQLPDIDPQETEEWLESLESIIDVDGPQRAGYILRAILKRARELNVGIPALIQTPYINTIPPEEEPAARCARRGGRQEAHAVRHVRGVPEAELRQVPQLQGHAQVRRQGHQAPDVRGARV